MGKGAVLSYSCFSRSVDDFRMVLEVIYKTLAYAAKFSYKETDRVVILSHREAAAERKEMRKRLRALEEQIKGVQSVLTEELKGVISDMKCLADKIDKLHTHLIPDPATAPLPTSSSSWTEREPEDHQ